MSFAEWFIGMFRFPFIQRAFVVGLILSLLAGLLGVNLYLKRYAMIGHCLSQVSFLGMAIAMAIGFSILPVAIPLTCVAAFVLLSLGERHWAKGDAGMALLSSASLALAVFLISLSTGLTSDVCNYMFGSILAVTSGELYLTLGLSLLVGLLYVYYYRRFFVLCFDEGYGRSNARTVKQDQLMLALLTALVLVLGIRLMGTLLMSALLIFPSLIAVRFAKSYKQLTSLAALISTLSFLFGLILSYAFNSPAGASIVLLEVVVYGGVLLWGRLSRG